MTNQLILILLLSSLTTPLFTQKDSLHLQLGHSINITNIAVSSDKKYFATSSWDTTVKLWDIQNNHLLHTFSEHHSLVNEVTFSPDAKYLAAAGEEGSTKIWEVETRKLVHTFENGSIAVTSLAFSADGQYLVTGDKAGELKIWKFSERILQDHLPKVPPKQYLTRPDKYLLRSL